MSDRKPKLFLTHRLISCFSAGIGRSGTYVGLDYLYDQAMARGSVKVFDCVRTMRKFRLNMVQTKVRKYKKDGVKLLMYWVSV